jgi:hypothetical protein
MSAPLTLATATMVGPAASLLTVNVATRLVVLLKELAATTK